jgi:hypothetical protein
MSILESDLRSRVEFITAGAKDIIGKQGRYGSLVALPGEIYATDFRIWPASFADLLLAKVPRGSIVIEATNGRPLYGNRSPLYFEAARLVEFRPGDVDVRLDKYIDDPPFGSGRKSRVFWVRGDNFGALAQAVIANWSDKELKTALDLIQGPLEKITGKSWKRNDPNTE